MNFKRVEIIFLFTFLAIDIFLFGMYQQNQNLQSENVSQGDSNSTIIKEMKNDQIKVGKLSDKEQAAYYVSGTRTNTLQQKMGQLTNQSTSFNDYELTSEFTQPINVAQDAPQETINKMLTDSTFILYGQQYQYSKELSDANTLVYTQKALGRNIYSAVGQIRFEINDQHQLIGYTQRYLEDIKSLREKSETISEERALIWLYQYNEIPNNTRIKWSKLEYTKLVNIDDNCVLIPTWVVAIKYNNSPTIQIKRINAFTGSIIKDSTSNIKAATNS